MTPRPLALATRLVRGWTWVYTSGIAPEIRERRRREVESDLWDFDDDARLTQLPPATAACQIVARLCLGVHDDIGWRREQPSDTAARVAWRLLAAATAVALVAHQSSTLAWLFVWFGSTWISTAIRESHWLYPILESAHVAALIVLVGLAVMLDLRLLGRTLRRTPVTEVMTGLLPLMKIGIAVTLLSGLVTFLSNPADYYANTFFRLKMGLLVIAAVNAWIYHVTIFRSVHEWDGRALTPRAARVAGAVSLLLWSGIIVSGRFMAYRWF